MPRCPFATWHPINTLYLPNRNKVAHNRMTVHITAGRGSPWGFFDHPQRASSEFFVYADGRIEQFMDSDVQAEADLEGSDASHSVENEGYGNAPLTPEQVAANAAIFAWLRDTHGVPNQIATDSKIGASSHGLSWHRLGVDGNFPDLPSPLAGRTQRGGGMHYSLARGKVCPGDDVVLQIPQIFALSQSGAVPVSNPITPAAPAPATKPAPVGPRLAADGQLWIDEDGYEGSQTISREQQLEGTPIDGVISTPYSTLVAAQQRRLISRGHSCGRYGADGDRGPATIGAMQDDLGTYRDGIISRPSAMVKAMQIRMNTGQV